MKKYVIMLGLFALFGCQENEPPMTLDFCKVYGGNRDVAELLRTVATQYLYFGHQSVGGNILNGIEIMSDESGVPIQIVETRDFTGDKAPALIHFRVGENGKPFEKIDDFSNLVSEIPCHQHAIAFFKLCYVDFQESTDVEALFEYYQERMLQIKSENPDLNIILVTVPYTTIQKGAKALAKRILFMPVSGEVENIRRHDFNQKVVGELGTEFQVFDLGLVETTLPDGTVNTYDYKGNTYPALPESYSSDFGHLNDFGSRVVAYNLMAFLADIQHQDDTP